LLYFRQNVEIDVGFAVEEFLWSYTPTKLPNKWILRL